MIFRWDHLSADPSGLGDPSETRWTLGLNYWLSPNTVVKAAYEWDKPNGEQNRNALFFQTAMGFLKPTSHGDDNIESQSARGFASSLRQLDLQSACRT